MMEPRKRNVRQVRKTGVALLLLIAMLCTVMPIQAGAMPSMPGEGEQAQAAAPGNDGRGKDPNALSNTEMNDRNQLSRFTDTSIVNPGDKPSSSDESEGAIDEIRGKEGASGGTAGETEGKEGASEGAADKTEGKIGASEGAAGEGSDDPGNISAAPFDGEAHKGPEPEQNNPIRTGLASEGDRYLLYIDGVQVTEEGWREIPIGKFYISSSGYVTARMEEIGGNWRYYEYDVNTSGWAIQKNAWKYVLEKEYLFGSSGACTAIFDRVTEQLLLFRNGQMVPAANQTYALSDSKLYFFAAKGIRTMEQGWKKASAVEWYCISNNGSISAKMESANGIWQYYDYNAQSSSWKKAANTWKVVDGKEYFFDSSGKCAKIYAPASGKCQVYSNGKMASVKKDICTLRNGKIYYFNGKGKQVTKEGWQKISGSQYMQVGKKGYVTCKMAKSKGIWRLYKYSYSSQKWVLQKDTWKRVDGKDYYFGKSGRNATIYDISTQKCKKYNKGKMAAIKNELCTLSNGKLYYFNAKGIRSTKEGWKKISAQQYVKVGKSGYVTHKMSNAKGEWKFYKQDYKSHKWKIQKKTWVTVDGRKYCFNAKGKCTLIYITKSKKCYDYKNGHMTLVRNDVRAIDGKKYYFGTDGVKVSAAGLYITSSNKLVYVKAGGRVTKEMQGTVIGYSSSDGKVTSCKVKENNHICYYNGQGILIRKLDLNGKMVALTYDDGPSQYTSVILDILEQHHGAATFFVVGQRVSDHASIIRRAYDMGCEIGNHTYSHQILTKVSVSAAQSQISMTNAAIRNVTGASPALFRPTGGNYNGTVASMAGMPLILWSIDTLDWKTKNTNSIQSAVLNQVKDGDIVLMHDLYSPTAEASKTIIPELISRGYQLVTVSELADCRGGMINGMVYNAFR